MYLLSLGSQIYVHVVGIEGESPNVIHNGLSELAGLELFGERVGMGKDRYAVMFSTIILKKLMF